MWPKALAQLLELAPHVTRLVPVADRYLQSKAESRDASRRAMQQMADTLRVDLGQIGEGVRGDLRQIAAAQAGIYHQLNDQSETLSRIAADMRTTRLASDEIEIRMTRIETRLSRLWITFFAGLIVFVIFTAGVVAVFAVIHIRQYVHGS
jgi:hypothetical protein